jgi:MFS family permease
MLSNGFSIGGLPAFYPEMLKEMRGLGSAPEVAVAGTITFVLSGLLSPLAGNLLNKFDLRLYMTWGCVMLGLGLLVYSQAQTKTWVYAAHFIFGLSLCFLSLIPNTVLVSNWFRKKRGTALGIVVTGTSLGTVVIPLLASPLIKAYGWRTAMLILSSSVWVILLPAIWLFIKVTPHSMGLLPDGAAQLTTEETPKPVGQLPGMTLGEAVRSPLFWVFSICAMMLFYAILAVVQQLIVFLTSSQIGMTGDQARAVQSLMGTASIFGKLIFGVLSDRLSRPMVNAICCCLLVLGSLMLPDLNADNTFKFAIVFGLGYGGAFVTIQLLISECFGLRDLGRIVAFIAIIETAGGGIGNLVTGMAAKTMGGYAAGYYGVIAAAFIALFSGVLLSFMMVKRRRFDEP